MEFPLVKTEKRYSSGGEELLRTVLSTPNGLEGEEMRELSRFISEIKERTLCFSEHILFPIAVEEYEALSPHDRKFQIPRRVYRVTVALERAEGEGEAEREETILRTVLLLALRRRGRNEFEQRIERIWARCGKAGVYKMVTESKKDRKLLKTT